jgi:hypothetical protein
MKGSRRFVLPRGLDLLPVALLLGIALQQIWLAQRDFLPAWSGGGFGMFATTDHWRRRHLHVWVVGSEGRRLLDLAAAREARPLDPLVHRVLALPTRQRLGELALLIADLPQVRGDESAEAIAVAVFARRHDAVTLEPSGELVRAVEVRLE